MFTPTDGSARPIFRIKSTTNQHQKKETLPQSAEEPQQKHHRREHVDVCFF